MAEKPSNGSRGAGPPGGLWGTPSRQVIAILEKHRRGGRLTRDETRRLARFERENEERLRWLFYGSVPKRLWIQWSGRSRETVRQHGAKYNFPLAGGRIDLAAVLRRFHDLLAENRKRLADAALVSPDVTPGLERYRLAKAAREEIQLERDRRETIDRGEARDALVAILNVLRRDAVGRLDAEVDPAAAGVLADAIETAEQMIEDRFGDGRPTPERSAGG